MDQLTPVRNKVAKTVTHTTIWLNLLKILKSKSNLHPIRCYAIANDLIASLAKEQPYLQQFVSALEQEAEESYALTRNSRSVSQEAMQQPSETEQDPEDPVNPISKESNST